MNSSATGSKNRLYDQLASSLNRLNGSISTTADLTALLQADLHALRIFATLDAAKLMTVGSKLNTEHEENDASQTK
ncbi:hypothetical protein BDV98DRAFT_587954 [Pterulicium gracile]|uniref:Uncharacterized protein n=1 Tax=Pterulicium gracile TaxID=1884261 RepID=A0A5C3R7U3_9AGAR|nr:hypothetical protein BDV98DRAFT_587954 [Pterula gracilis]